MKMEIKDGVLFFDLGDNNEHDCVLRTKSDGAMHMVEFANIFAKDDNTLDIDGKMYWIGDVELTTMEAIGNEFIEAEPIYMRSFEDCLPSDEGFPLLYAVAIRAMKQSKPLPLTQTQHNRKLATIRELNKIGKKEKAGMSIHKLEELLSFYGLELRDLLRDEYL